MGGADLSLPLFGFGTAFDIAMPTIPCSNALPVKHNGPSVVQVAHLARNHQDNVCTHPISDLAVSQTGL